MNLFKRQRLAIATTVYWVLLAYIIAGLVWWFIALQTQNRQMAGYKLQGLKMDDPLYEIKLNAILSEQQRKMARNSGDGSSFVLRVLLGALVVEQEVRRQVQ